VGIKLVEVERDVADGLPECSSGSQILATIEGADLFRSKGIWGSTLRQGARFILRSLDDSPLLIVNKEMSTVGIADAQPGEQVAWEEYKKPEAPFIPGSLAINPLQFIAGSMVRVSLGDDRVEITLVDDSQTFLEGDYPGSCRFEAGNPTVQFGFVPDEWILNEKPVDFSG
jgi:hypothetical protein